MHAHMAFWIIVPPRVVLWICSSAWAAEGPLTGYPRFANRAPLRMASLPRPR